MDMIQYVASGVSRTARSRLETDATRRKTLCSIGSGEAEAGKVARVPSRPSFSTAPRKGLTTLATLRKPLCREFLFYPVAISLEIGGQWPVCCAGASPTEDPQPRIVRAAISPSLPPGSTSVKRMRDGWCYS